ncbi:hypothetical protein SDC9_111524 [bioreactor metagenome]|uniref:Uncharacterized protein n=1 Tax=bioreactor metagenome TaxID=1076179 RepID=A0A645BGZ5_9ZZZZ
MAVLIVLGALFGIDEHFRRFVEFLEFCFRLFIARMQVGVAFLCTFTERALDLLYRCGFGNAQYLVIIAFVSQFPLPLDKEAHSILRLLISLRFLLTPRSGVSFSSVRGRTKA